MVIGQRSKTMGFEYEGETIEVELNTIYSAAKQASCTWGVPFWDVVPTAIELIADHPKWFFANPSWLRRNLIQQLDRRYADERGLPRPSAKRTETVERDWIAASGYQCCEEDATGICTQHRDEAHHAAKELATRGEMEAAILNGPRSEDDPEDRIDDLTDTILSSDEITSTTAGIGFQSDRDVDPAIAYELRQFEQTRGAWLATLTEDTRQAVELAEDGLGTRGIAVALGLSQSKVCRLLRTARDTCPFRPRQEAA